MSVTGYKFLPLTKKKKQVDLCYYLLYACFDYFTELCMVDFYDMTEEIRTDIYYYCIE